MKSHERAIWKKGEPLCVVVDTCVIIDAAGANGPDKARPAIAALDFVKKNGQIAYSHPCMMEWFLVASRATLAVQMLTTPSAAWNLASQLMRTGQKFIPSQTVDICPDPEDNKWLALSKAANAHVLLTQDRDLLNLHAFEGTQIMRPREFMASYAQCHAVRFKSITLKGECAPHDAAYGRQHARLIGAAKKPTTARTKGASQPAAPRA